jgi:ParB family chromosome partitioning protein
MNKRRDALKEMLAPVAAPSMEMRPPQPASKSGSLKAMGLSLRNLSQEAEAADVLRRQISDGSHIVDIDPHLIDASFIRDRLTDDVDPQLDELTQSIETSGQQVPILVRPHPDQAGRYQAAYGHRRIAALRRLGIPARAVVKGLSDLELVVAQGKENLERQDLSFIERALFAARLEDRGFARAALMNVLAVHKGNLSTMIALVRRIPAEIIEAIGPAPKIGRPRWEDLAEALGGQGASERAREVIMRAGFSQVASDSRFAEVLKVAQQKAPAPAQSPTQIVHEGKPIARLDRSGKLARFVIDDKNTEGFAAYLADKLPELYGAFRRGADQ